METQGLISQNAFELFKRYGFRSVTMDAVAAQCGISKKTLYQHFEDKDKLVYTILHHMISKSEAQCAIYQQTSENAVHEIFQSLDMLREMFEGINPVMLYDLHKYHQSAYKKLEDHKHHFLYEVTRKNLERGVAEGLYRTDMNIEVITLLHLYTISMTFEQEAFKIQKFSIVEMQQQIMLHYVYGIATAKGVRQIEKYEKQLAVLV